MKFEPETVDYFLDMVKHHASKELTPWETQFIESIDDQWGRSRHLSDKQLEILERIYAEKTD